MGSSPATRPGSPDALLTFFHGHEDQVVCGRYCANMGDFKSLGEVTRIDATKPNQLIIHFGDGQQQTLVHDETTGIGFIEIGIVVAGFVEDTIFLAHQGRREDGLVLRDTAKRQQNLRTREDQRRARR